MTGHESLSCAETTIEYTCENSQYSKYSANLLSFHLCPRLQMRHFSSILSWKKQRRCLAHDVWPMIGPFKTKCIAEVETLDIPAWAEDENLTILL